MLDEAPRNMARPSWKYNHALFVAAQLTYLLSKSGSKQVHTMNTLHFMVVYME